MSGKETTSLSLGRESLISLGSKGLNAVVGFGGVILFARVLGDVGLGEYRTVIGAGILVAQVSSGVGSSVRKRVSEVDTSPGAFLGGGLAFHALFTLLATFVFVLVRPVAVGYFGTIELAIGAVLIATSLGLFDILNKFHSGIGYPGLASWVDSVRSILTVAFQVVFLFLGLQAFGLVLGYVIATAASALISFWMARIVPLRPTTDVARRIYDFARWIVPSGILSNIYGSADVLIIRAVAGASPVGFYTVAAQLAQPAAMFGSTIYGALGVKTSGRDSAGMSVRPDLKNAMSYSGLIAIPMLFGALAIPNALMTTLFGAQFSKAPGLVLVGMMSFQLFNVYSNSLSSVITSVDRPDLIFKTNLAVMPAHVVVAYLVGLEYGLLGVVGSSVVAIVVQFGIYQYVAHREFGGVVFTRPMGEQVVCGAVMYVVVWALSEYVVTITNWIWLLVVVGIGATVYFVVLVGVSSHFRDTLGYVLPFLPDPDSGE